MDLAVLSIYLFPESVFSVMIEKICYVIVTITAKFAKFMLQNLLFVRQHKEY